MRVALLGRIGDIGESLVLRRAYRTDHEVAVGSRDPDKTCAKVDGYETELSNHDRDVKINGFTNETAANRASVVVLAVPPYHVSDTVEAVSDSLSEGDILVMPAADMKCDDDGFCYHPPETGSVAALVADAASDDVSVVGAFHNLAAGRLTDLDADLGIDTPLVADDEDARETMCLLTEGIDGLHALGGGGLVSAPRIKGITPLLTSAARNNDDLHDLGTRFK